MSPPRRRIIWNIPEPEVQVERVPAPVTMSPAAPFFATIVPALPFAATMVTETSNASNVYVPVHSDLLYHDDDIDWDMVDLENCTTLVSSDSTGLIGYTKVNAPSLSDTALLDARAMNSVREQLNVAQVQTFLREAGCALLQPFEIKTDAYLKNLIESLRSFRITHERSQAQVVRKRLANCLSRKKFPVNPIKGSSLSFKELVVKEPAPNVTEIKPDVLRWRMCYIRLGAYLTERLFHCFTSKYNIYLLPEKNSTDRTWARSILEVEYVAIMQDWTCNGTKDVDDADLGYEHLPLLKLRNRDHPVLQPGNGTRADDDADFGQLRKGLFASGDCWWIKEEATSALVAQDLLASLTKINVPFDAYETIVFTHEELRHHFPEIDASEMENLHPRPLPKMRSLASYYYSKQMSHPLGLNPKSRRRRLLQFAHDRETAGPAYLPGGDHGETAAIER